MNPAIQELVQQAVTGKIGIDAFLAAMAREGITQGEAQTLLSKAVSPPQSADPALEQQRHEPVTNAQSQVPPMTATSPTGDHQPSLLQKLLNSPAVRAAQTARQTIQPYADRAREAIIPPTNPMAAQAGTQVAAAAPRPVPQPAPQPAPQSEGGGGDGPQVNLPTFARGDLPPSMSQAPESPAARAVQTARQTLAPRPQPQMGEPGFKAPLPPVPEREAAPQSSGPGFLSQVIRGDFSPDADKRVLEAVRRQREESGVDENRARGGAAPKAKKSSRDDVLHKALDIIHQLMMRH